MAETTNHTELKQLAKTMLVNMGFGLDQIHEEYKVEIPTFTNSRSFRVDVCGISPNKSVAIECGQTTAEKLVNLNLFFDEVYQLPYGLKKIDTFEKVYDDAIKEITELRETTKQQKNKIIELEHKIRGLKEQLERWSNVVVLIKAASDLLFKISGQYIYYGNEAEVTKVLDLFLKEESTG